MCRMILASGQFDPPQVFRAAWLMATGRTADHERPVACHPDGWGAVFRDPAAPDGLRAVRFTDPMPGPGATLPPVPPGTDFLAVHVRHATRAETQGEPFAHPVTRPRPVQWYLLHNGYLPTAYRQLGLAASAFDTAEMFEYLVPPADTRLDRDEVLARLGRLGAGGSAANAIFVNPTRAYVLQWSFPTAPPLYFTLFRYRGPAVTYVASERVPDLAPAAEWEPLSHGDLIELPFRTLSTETEK